AAIATNPAAVRVTRLDGRGKAFNWRITGIDLSGAEIISRGGFSVDRTPNRALVAHAKRDFRIRTACNRRLLTLAPVCRSSILRVRLLKLTSFDRVFPVTSHLPSSVKRGGMTLVTHHHSARAHAQREHYRVALTQELRVGLAIRDGIDLRDDDRWQLSVRPDRLPRRATQHLRRAR
ncbi:MAG: hypothetical protein ACJAY5_000110, partial [Actinomycetes bacterium]